MLTVENHCFTSTTIDWFILKEESVILTTSFYDINQKILTPKKKRKKKKLFANIQLIQILRLQVMYKYVHWHCSIDYCVKLSLVDETLCENCH